MNWIEISVQADGEAAEAVSELFNRLNSRPDGQGGAVTEISGFDPVGEDHHPFVTVKTYLPAGEADTAERQAQIEEGLWFLGRIYPLGEPCVRPLAEEDWANAWKASYHPLRIGRRFLVVPAWLAAPAARDQFPPAATGGRERGHSPSSSTRAWPSAPGCTPARSFACGDGGRSAAQPPGVGCRLRLRHPEHRGRRLGAGRVDAFDIDPIAMRATEENAALNDLPVAIHAFISAGPGCWPLLESERPPAPPGT